MANSVITFRKKHDLQFKIIKHRAESIRLLLKANGYIATIIFEEQIALVTVPSISICTAVSIRNIIKHYKIYD